MNNNYKNILLKLKQLLDANEIFFWIDSGTLLGAYRDKEILPWDDDVDIALWTEDYWKVKRIIEHSKWKFKAIWRREIALYHEDFLNCHIDLFFYDKLENNKIAHYVCLEDRINHNVNVESSVIADKEILEEFKSYRFYGEIFNIPAKTDEYLTSIYGNWKKPQKKWYYSNCPNINRDHRTIGIIIPTFIRDDKMMVCVNSIIQTYGKVCNFQPFIRIYIADQGLMTPEKQEFYNHLETMGHKYYIVPFNSGLSYCRNYLVNKVKEPYVLVMDDDYEFNETTNLDAFLKLIILEENIGIVGGTLNNILGNYSDRLVAQHKIKNQLVQINAPITKYLVSSAGITQKSYRYIETKMVSNFFLAKKELFNDIKWDEELKLVEHTDFFLRLKTTKWKVLFTPEVNAIHHQGENPPQYDKYRNRTSGKNCTTSIEKFYKKWNLDTSIKYITVIPEHDFYIPQEKIKIIQLARIPCANSPGEANTLINIYSNQYSSQYILGNEYKTGANGLIPGRKMPIDLSWINNKEACLKALREADIIHVHHDCINDSEVINILKNKPVIWTLYNLTQSLKILENPFNIDYDKKVRELSNLITVADQSLQRTIFDYITNTTIPLIKMLFNEHTEKNNEIPVVVFAPTNKSNEGVATKKYDSVLRIIEELKQEGYRFEFDLIEGIPYEENLNRKEKADIIIDDVDSNYNKFHNTSIEAACFGAIALTNYTGLDYPFIKTNIYNLKETLIKFITNPTLLKEEQEKIIEWRKNNYTPEILLSSYEKLYYNLLNNETYSNKVKSNLNSIPKTETLQTPKETNSAEENSPLNIKKAVYAFLQEIKSKNINFWLIKDSCLEVLQYKELRTNKLQIGVSSVVEQRIIENLCSGLTFLVEVFVEPNRKTKEWNLYEVCVKVPYPLKTYLERYTGQSWNQLKINE